MSAKCCQWCGAEYTSAARNGAKLYCSKACKTAFNNWMTVVGRRLAPVAMAWRAGRGGKGVSSAAMKELCALLDRDNEAFRNRAKGEGVTKLPTIQEHYDASRKSNGIIRAIDVR